MIHKSVVTSALCLVLLPTVAGALGLGGISTQSALNEPFFGQIELLDVQPDELDTVKVKLASDDEFDKAGAARPHFLTRLAFKPQASPTGQTRIRVTSHDPVREPFLDFLVEVTWPKGRLVKEYTVLLDPPVTLKSMPLRQGARRAVRSRTQLARPPEHLDEAVFPIRHGPVRRGSNLWRIAREMAPATGATVAQTALALYRNNEDAFIRGDIDLLKAGQILEIPTAAELFALDKRAADQEFRAALRGERVAATPLTDIWEPESQDRLQIAGASELISRVQPAAEAPPQPLRPQLPSTEVPPAEAAVRESTPQAPAQAASEIVEASAIDETEPGLGAIKEDLLLVQEAGESTRQETEELRSRIRELEGQLADIQRLLELSNERFAALQKTQSAQLDVTAAEATDVPPMEIGAAQESGETAIPQAEAAPALEVASETALPKPGPEESIKTSDAEPSPGSDRPFWESIPRSPLVLTSTLALMLLLLAWIVRRRRASLEETLTSQDFVLETTAAPAPTAPVERTQSGPIEAATVTPPTSSPYSGFKTLDGETEEADVISEADIYIAYGRYREAEKLLEEAIENSPDRMDAKYKLAEAYYGAGNLQRMEALMEDMKKSGGDRTNPDQWRQLNHMMQGLRGGGISGLQPPAAVAGAEVFSSDGLAPGTDQESIVPPPPPLGVVSESEPETEIEAPEVASTPDSTGTPQLEIDSQDFALDIGDLGVTTAELEASESEGTLELGTGASDLELQLEDLESLDEVDLDRFYSQDAPPKPVTVDELSAIPADSQEEPASISSGSLDSLDSGIVSTPTQWQKDSGAWDEVATKVDLARAYLEMEDPEAARVILEEVAQEGNNSQRAEAKEMLAKLG
jgi:pilus assembly protein FimV